MPIASEEISVDDKYNLRDIMQAMIQAQSVDFLISQEDGKYYAHYMPFDLLGMGDTKEKAVECLREMIVEYVDFCCETESMVFVWGVKCR